jgi:hypothetical protein
VHQTDRLLTRARSTVSAVRARLANRARPDRRRAPAGAAVVVEARLLGVAGTTGTDAPKEGAQPDPVAAAYRAGPGGAGPVALGLVEPGLVISPHGSAWDDVPTLVPWERLVGFGAEEPADPSDAGAGQLLEVTEACPGVPGRTEVRRFAVAAPDLVVFFRALGEWSRRWAEALTPEPPGLGIRAGQLATAFWLAVVGWTTGAGELVRSRLPTLPAPRHGQGSRRLAPLAVGWAALALMAGGATTTLGAGPPAGLHSPAARFAGGNRAAVIALADMPVVHLAPATIAPNPTPPSLAGTAPLRPHEIFGYAPYWTLPSSGSFDVAGLTTIAYFSVDVNGDGTLQQSGPGWNGYQSQDLVNLVDRAHAAGDRVVLTVTCFSQSALDQLTHDPAAPATLAHALVAAVEAKHLDGVDFDFEGQGSADRHGLTSLVTTVSSALRAADPHWQVTMATYASAAGDPSGFYDIPKLAPAVDAFFVMAYDMNDPISPGATAPLVGGGFSDAEALRQYLAVVPPQKVILGVPFYGYDWPTVNGTLGAPAMGGETPLSYAQIAAAGHPTYWDPATDTAWTSYQVDGQWHETYFDNPTSLAMKAELANATGIAGLGIWALGMDGNDPAMLAALLGKAPPVKDLSTGPVSTPPSVSTTTTDPGGITTAQWQGSTVTLTPEAAGSTPSAAGGLSAVGTVTGVQTTDPVLSCLMAGPPLGVWSFGSDPGVDVVIATQPGDCVTEMFTFVPPAGTTGGTPGSGSVAPPAVPTSTTPTPTTDPSGSSTTSSSSSTSTTDPSGSSTTSSSSSTSTTDPSGSSTTTGSSEVGAAVPSSTSSTAGPASSSSSSSVGSG